MGLEMSGNTMTHIVLGIESSCDETACALVDEDRNILASQVWSQYDEHRCFGGVVPEIAARAHLEKCDFLIKNALDEANISLDDISAVSVAAGPGLIGGVLVGVITAKTIAMCKNKPFIAINHLEAHALMARLQNPSLEFPYLLLLTSGGHCQILLALGVGRFVKLGGTLDDSAGEAFDKVAKMLDVGYPGGPHVEKIARNASNPHQFVLPIPMKGKKGCDFSFSGLKTSVRTLIQKSENLSKEDKANICASFQNAVVEQILDRLKHAIEMAFEIEKNVSSLVISGGVAANIVLREKVTQLALKNRLNFFAPEPKLCTDNGVMIAWAGMEYFKENRFSPLDFKARPRWPLDENNP